MAGERTMVPGPPRPAKFPGEDDTTVRESAEFQRAVRRLRSECRQLGLALPVVTAENILAGVVRDLAERLRVTDDTIVRLHMDSFDTGPMADLLVRTRTEREQQVADTSPAILDIPSTGRLVASLAQAVRCARLNHQRLAEETGDNRHTIAVLDDVSNALTLIGEALEQHHNAPHSVAVLLSAESVAHTRRALTRTVANLQSDAWPFGHGRGLDTGAAARIQTSLALLPEQ